MSEISSEKDWTLPPGETIKELMYENRIGNSVVAWRLGLSEVGLDALLAGQRPITWMLARRLERLFRVSASFWINAEDLFRRELAAGLQVPPDVGATTECD